MEDEYRIVKVSYAVATLYRASSYLTESKRLEKQVDSVIDRVNPAQTTRWGSINP